MVDSIQGNPSFSDEIPSDLKIRDIILYLKNKEIIKSGKNVLLLINT